MNFGFPSDEDYSSLYIYTLRNSFCFHVCVNAHIKQLVTNSFYNADDSLILMCESCGDQRTQGTN